MTVKGNREVGQKPPYYAFNLKYREERSPIDFMQILRSVGPALRASSNNTFMGSQSESAS